MGDTFSRISDKILDAEHYIEETLSEILGKPWHFDHGWWTGKDVQEIAFGRFGTVIVSTENSDRHSSMRTYLFAQNHTETIEGTVVQEGENENGPWVFYYVEN